MALHPSSVKNTFGGHLILWVLFLPLLALIFTPLVNPHQEVAEAEIEMVKALNIDSAGVTAKANNTFATLFVATGVMKGTEEFFSGTIFGKSQNKNTVMTGKWIRGVWLMIYKAVWRMYVLVAVFLFPLLALCIPSAVDGFTIRARKKYRFESYNPIFFYSSMHSAVLIVGLFCFMPLAPMTLSSTIMAGMLGLLAFSVWFATANFQTGS